MKKIFIILPMILFSTTSWAKTESTEAMEAPKYDIAAYCDSIAKGTKDPLAVKKMCIAHEQEAIQRMLKTRPYIEEINYCKNSNTLDSYEQFTDCIEYYIANRGKIEVPKTTEETTIPSTCKPKNIPDFDIKAHCKEIAEFSGDSAVIELGCRKMEQQALEDILKMDIDEKTMRHCTDVAKFNGGSYSILKGCIDMEQQAAQQL